MTHSLQKSTEISDSFCLNKNVRKTEKKFSDFYEKIMKSLYEIESFRFRNIRKSLGNIRSRKNLDVEIHKTVDFEEESCRCAYVFAYSIIHSAVMYDRFSDMMKRNPRKLKTISSLKKIKLCILGGPAFEVAAICELLSSVLGQSDCGKPPPLQVCVTVIDICAGWETEAKSISSAYGTGTLDVNFRFIKADVTEDFSRDVLKAFENAHFVTMFKFASEINCAYGEEEVFGVLRKIIDAMSYKSCLFILDNSGGDLFYKIDRMIDRRSGTKRIYGPSLHYGYELNPETIENFSAGLKGVFLE